MELLAKGEGFKMDGLVKVGDKCYYRNIVSKNVAILRLGTRILVFDKHIEVDGILKSRSEWRYYLGSIEEFQDLVGNIKGLETIYHVVYYLATGEESGKN